MSVSPSADAACGGCSKAFAPDGSCYRAQYLVFSASLAGGSPTHVRGARRGRCGHVEGAEEAPLSLADYDAVAKDEAETRQTTLDSDANSERHGGVGGATSGGGGGRDAAKDAGAGCAAAGPCRRRRQRRGRDCARAPRRGRVGGGERWLLLVRHTSAPRRTLRTSRSASPPSLGAGRGHASALGLACAPELVSVTSRILADKREQSAIGSVRGGALARAIAMHPASASSAPCTPTSAPIMSASDDELAALLKAVASLAAAAAVAARAAVTDEALEVSALARPDTRWCARFAAAMGPAAVCDAHP